MGCACLAFFVVAAWRCFSTRKQIYVARNVQFECGKDSALELETERYLLHGFFNTRPKSELTSVKVTFICTLIVFLLAFVLGIIIQLNETKTLQWQWHNINNVIFLSMIVLMPITYKLLESHLKTKVKIRSIYADLQSTLPSKLDGFPPEFVQTLVRRWYAVYPEDNRSLDDVKRDFEDLLTNHAKELKSSGTLTPSFYKFLGFVNPKTDIGFAEIERNVGSIADGTTQQDARKARSFFERMRPLIDPWEHSEGDTLAENSLTIEWLLFWSFALLAFFYILAPMLSITVFMQLYG